MWSCHLVVPGPYRRLGGREGGEGGGREGGRREGARGEGEGEGGGGREKDRVRREWSSRISPTLGGRI